MTAPAPARPKTAADVRPYRLRAPVVEGLLTIAVPWAKNTHNLGTLARTCDALHAGLVVPADSNAVRALRKGDRGKFALEIATLLPDVLGWIAEKRAAGTRVVGVELAHGAIPLHRLAPAVGPTIVVLGNEGHGTPRAAFDLFDEVCEISMFGCGTSLNVAVAGSLVLYRLAGLS